MQARRPMQCLALIEQAYGVSLESLSSEGCEVEEVNTLCCLVQTERYHVGSGADQVLASRWCRSYQRCFCSQPVFVAAACRFVRTSFAAFSGLEIFGVCSLDVDTKGDQGYRRAFFDLEVAA